jgi:hypothetical protein
MLAVVLLLTGSCSSVADRHFQGTVDAVAGSLPCRDFGRR